MTISSTILPKPLTATTDSTGVSRFPSLAVGTYKVSVSLNGFKTKVREQVVVVQNQTVALDMSLGVGNLSEVVTVTETSPVVDTKNVSVAVNLDQKLLETTPGGKDIWSILQSKVPGIVFDTPDVGGNQAGLQRSFSSRGTPNAQNTQYLNGVNVGDPAAIGFSMNYYDPSAFSNIQVSSGAQDISVGTPGVFINLVTKSGSNRFSAQALETYQGKKTQSRNVDTRLLGFGFRPDSNAVDYITNTNGQAGGPVLKDRLFYFGSLNFQPTHVNVIGFPAVVPAGIPTPLSNTNNQDTTDILTGEGKLTYQLNSRNRFETYFQKQRYDKPNRGSSSGNTQDSDQKEFDIDNTIQGLWNLVISDRMFVTTNVNYNNVHFPLYQKTALQPLADSATGVQLRNNTQSQIMFRQRISATSSWQYFMPKLFGGRHEFKAGFDESYTPEDVGNVRIDNVSLVYNSVQNGSTAPGPVSVTVFNTPTAVKRAVNNTYLFAQDSFTFRRLTATGGIRWERVEGKIPPQTHASSQYYPSGTTIGGLNVALNTGGTLNTYVVQDSFAAVSQSPLWHDWAPRFSSAYDLNGNGKTVLKFSTGKYLYQIGTGTPGPNPNGSVNQRYAWNDLNGDLNFQSTGATWDGLKYVGAEFGALQATTVPNPNPFDRTLRRTYQNEITAGVDREIFPNILFTGTFIHRREHDVQGTVDQILSQWGTLYSQVQVTEQGPDGVLGNADDKTLTVYSLNKNPDGSLPATSPKTVNDDRLATHYNGVELTVNKRYSNGWTVLAGYTYSHTRVDLTSLSNPNNAFVNANGESGGRRHNFKASGSYLFPWDIQFGINYEIASGLPITRTVSVAGCTTTVTTNCVNQGATTVNAVPRGSVSLSALGQLSTRVGKIFRFPGHTLEFDMDVYNLTNANTTYAVRTGSTTTLIRYAGDPANPQTSIPMFLSPTGVLGPRILRFNVTYGFGGR